METKVSLDRISKFLDEDEVTEQVSSLKRSDSGVPTLEGEDDGALGIENGSFKWNEIEVEKATGPPVSEDSGTVVAAADTVDPTNMDHRFELKDINVIFPDGELSLITGPTASGKTGLLVGFR